MFETEAAAHGGNQPYGICSPGELQSELHINQRILIMLRYQSDSLVSQGSSSSEIVVHKNFSLYLPFFPTMV